MPALKFKRRDPKRLMIDLIVLAAVILLGVSGWLWWNKIVMDPGRVLDDAIARNLQTRSIVKHVSQSGVTGGVEQTSYLSFFPPSVRSQASTVLSQGIGSNSASITTETIGTPEVDYVRYTSVEGADNLIGTDRLKQLLGIWSKREQNVGGNEASFLNETLFGILPYGYFNDEQRSQLIEMLDQKDVYRYTSTTKSIENKRPVYTYEMSINPSQLVEFMRQYTVLSGVGNPSDLDPEQYKGLGDIRVRLVIDILSRQVKRIEYPTGRTETYNGQNLYRQIELPSQTIPVEELQRRLQGQNA
ncbi:MAG TPA: hypothetical protein VFX86_02445 [Candidatus Saccharimonadales bacterium]|nr:hypothetical protein [Candidatus Saccharimonadales bacterium]